MVVLAAALAATAGCGSEDAEPVAGPAVTPQATIGPFEWLRVDLDFHLDSAVALGDGFVGQAVDVTPAGDATANDPFAATVVTSPDGITWNEPDIPVLQPSEIVQWQDGGRWGAVASVMSSPMSGDVGIVPDLLFTQDGETWMRGHLPDDVREAPRMSFGPDSYAAGRAGVMAAVPLQGPQGAESVVLLTHDLQTWQQVEHPLPASGDMGLEVRANPDGEYLLSRPVSSEVVGDGLDPVPIVAAVSADGQTWDLVTSTEEYGIAGTGNDWSAGWRNGFVLVADVFAEPGRSDERPGQILLTTAGETWEEVDTTALSGSPVRPGEFQGSSLGLVLLGKVWSGDGPGTTADDTYLEYTADGQIWQVISTRETFGAGDVDPVVLGEAALLVGARPEAGVAGEQTRQIWLGTPVTP